MESIHVTNSRAGKVGDYNKSQRGGGVASLLNAVDYSDGPDCFPIDTRDFWPPLLSWGHNTSRRNHGFKEHLAYIHQAEMKLQLFAQVLSGVSEEGGVGGGGGKIITPRFSGSRERTRKLQSPCQPHLPISGNHPALFIPQSTGSMFLPPESERSGVQNCHWRLSLLCHDICWHLVSWLPSFSVHFVKWNQLIRNLLIVAGSALSTLKNDKSYLLDLFCVFL